MIAVRSLYVQMGHWMGLYLLRSVVSVLFGRSDVVWFSRNPGYNGDGNIRVLSAKSWGSYQHLVSLSWRIAWVCLWSVQVWCRKITFQLCLCFGWIISLTHQSSLWTFQKVVSRILPISHYLLYFPSSKPGRYFYCSLYINNQSTVKIVC